MNWTDNVLHGWCPLRVGADITVLREREVDYDSEIPRKIAEVLIRKVPDDQQVGEPSVEQGNLGQFRFAPAASVCMRKDCLCGR